MRIAITGSHGLIGSALAKAAAARGWRVYPLARMGAEALGPPDGASDREAIAWAPARRNRYSAQFENIDAVVNLGGANLAEGRWTPARKRELIASRVPGTRLIAELLAQLDRPPTVLVSASAVGWYGSRGGEELTEESSRGHGFLADLCEAWERATDPAVHAGIRVVNSRFGLVLSAQGGALHRMMPPFRLGLGGPMGSGRQVWSWIALDDVVRAIFHVIQTPSLAGPVNVTAPGAVTNREFARALGRALHRPAVLPVPGFVLRTALGEMAEMVLTGQRVTPVSLMASGFYFAYPGLDAALHSLLTSR